MKILASMKLSRDQMELEILFRSKIQLNFLNYSGRIGIEIQFFYPTLTKKKQYGLTNLKRELASNNNVSILECQRRTLILNGLGFDLL
jgi:hypothetical protein